MNNKQKQYVSSLERRIMTLETAVTSIVNSFNSIDETLIHNLNSQNIFCTQCSVNVYPGFECQITDCCHGLNPNDDLEKVNNELPTRS